MNGWPTPVPVRDAVSVPEFPTSVLPAWLAEMVDATAVFYQVPADLPGMIALSALAACCGGRVEVEARPGFVEPTNLYAAVALPPGSRKSPPFRRLSAPIEEVERELAKASLSEVARSRARWEMARKRADAAKAVAARATDPQEAARLEQEAQDAEETAAATVELKQFRLLADDATPEQLATLIADQRGRLSVLADEAAIFGQMRGRYSANGDANLEVFLKAHDGGTLRVDRRGREEYVERPALTIGVTVQPSVLRAVGENGEFTDRGLPARFLFSLPSSKVGHREIRPPAIPGDVSDAYDRELGKIARLHLPPTNPVSGDPAKVIRLTLSAEADALLEEWETQVEQMLGYGGALHPIVGWGSKLVGQTVRIAGLLHIAEHPDLCDEREIGESAMLSAMMIADYLIGHMLAVHSMLGSSDVKDIAEKVVQKLRHTKRSEPFSRNQMFKSIRDRSVSKANDLIEPFNLLEELGWIRKVDEGGSGPQGGRPKSPVYEAHPLLCQDQEAAEDDDPEEAA